MRYNPVAARARPWARRTRLQNGSAATWSLPAAAAAGGRGCVGDAPAAPPRPRRAARPPRARTAGGGAARRGWHADRRARAALTAANGPRGARRAGATPSARCAAPTRRGAATDTAHAFRASSMDRPSPLPNPPPPPPPARRSLHARATARHRHRPSACVTPPRLRAAAGVTPPSSSRDGGPVRPWPHRQCQLAPASVATAASFARPPRTCLVRAAAAPPARRAATTCPRAPCASAATRCVGTTPTATRRAACVYRPQVCRLGGGRLGGRGGGRGGGGGGPTTHAVRCVSRTVCERHGRVPA